MEQLKFTTSMRYQNWLGTVFLLATFVFYSCLSDNNSNDYTPVILKTFELDLSAQFSIPANTDRDETGTAILSLYDNNELVIDITINNLSSSEVLTAAHIHSGDLVTNGGVLITMVGNEVNIAFNGIRATGIILLSAQQSSELQGEDIYLNVHSQDIPSGLVRGPVDKMIDFAADVPLMPDYEIPAVTGRSETGIAHLRLSSDSELYFNLMVNDLSSTDMLTAAHIHLGDLVSNGGVSTPLVSGFSGNSATGMVMLSSQELSDLMSDNVYVHSQDNPGGLVRGSVDKVIDFAMDVLVSPDNSVPPILGRSETGITYLRLTAGSDLYYKLIINDLDSSDALTAAHIHAASSGTNGGVFQGLASGASDFDITKMLTLDAANRTIFLNDDLYVNVHTTQQPGGLLRGQIR